MKRSHKLSSGVTLLEIMLVLAIAAMVIVMSIRYYQSAQQSQQSNTLMEQIQAISAAADSLAQGSDYTAVSTTALTNVLGNASRMIDPWGSAITVTAQAPTTYAMSIPAVPSGPCTSVKAQLLSNTRFTAVSACAAVGASATLTYTYDSTK